MNASLESMLPARGNPPLLHRPCSMRPLARACSRFPGELALHHGGKLSSSRIAWRMTGPASAPVVCALGGISANRRVCSLEEPSQGWWSEIVGAGRALDCESLAHSELRLPRRQRRFNWTAGGAANFPSISSYDQAEALLRLLNHLGVKSLRAIVGGSYGGMVALAFGERYPDRVLAA